MLRSLLFVPGSRPDRVDKARRLGADAVILDLEDGVALAEKDGARANVRAALERPDFGGSHVLCRVNDASTGRLATDVEAVWDRVDGIILPKAEGADTVRALDDLLTGLGATDRPAILPLIESPRGVLDARSIAAASPRVAALIFGSEDFAATFGIERTLGGAELSLARALLALASAAEGVQAIDTIWLDLDNQSGLLDDTRAAAQLGFHGRLVVHPKQLDVVHRAFAPRPEQVQWAERVVDAWHRAAARGEGVFALDGKIVDRPVLLQAERILRLDAAGTDVGR